MTDPTPLGPGSPGSLDGIEVQCSCGRPFRVPRSLKGGFANCPNCHKAVEVRGGKDWELRGLIGIGAALLLAVTLGVWAAAGLGAALVALLVGAVILLIIGLAL